MLSFVGLILYINHHESNQNGASAVYNDHRTEWNVIKKIAYFVYVTFTVIIGFLVIGLGVYHIYLNCKYVPRPLS